MRKDRLPVPDGGWLLTQELGNLLNTEE
jgi:hypothetical protein